MRRLSTSLLACLLLAVSGDSRRTGQELPHAQPVHQASAEPAPPAPGKGQLSVRTALERLRAYVGVQLEDLADPDTSALLRAIERLVPGRRYERPIWDYRPRRIWQFRKRQGQPLLILFEVVESVPHPGCTPIRVTVLDHAGRLISETSFGTGHRCYLGEVKLEAAGGEYPLIVLGTGPGPGPGPNFARQYYAILGRRVDLVRVEDFGGAATRNRYHVPHFRCGPKPPLQTERKWESDLRSNDRRRILRALAWLGAVHRDLRNGEEPDHGQGEPAEDVVLVRTIRQRQGVAARLAELAASKDRWIREAALLALKPKDRP